MGKVTLDYMISKSSPFETSANTVTINVRPRAVNQTFNTPQNSTYYSSGLHLLQGASYPTSYTPTVTIKTNPTRGTVTLTNSSTGQFTYIPSSGFNGTDTFTYYYTVNGVDSADATVTMRVGTGASSGSYTFSTTVDSGGLSVYASNGLLATYGLNSGYTVLRNASTSSYFTLYSDGAFTFVPPTGQSGIFPLQFTLRDPNGVESAQSVDVAVRPRGTNSSYETSNNVQFSLNSTQARTTNLGSNLRATVTANPASGTLNMLTDGSFTYTPNAGFVGTDSFRYRLTDTVANLDSDEITVSIRVLSDSLIPIESYYPTLPPTGEAESINWLLYCLGAAVVLGGVYVLYAARKRMAKK